MNNILYVVITFGVIISLANIYVACLWVFKKQKAGSAIPMLGSLFLFISLFFIKNKLLFAIIFILTIMDTGGIHWFIGTMLYCKWYKKGKCYENS